MWQIQVNIPDAGNYIVGPFEDDQEDEAQAVANAWYRAAAAAPGIPGIGNLRVEVQLKKYYPMPAHTDIDWLYSKYIQPRLDYSGS